jgi:hypothetical protein
MDPLNFNLFKKTAEHTNCCDRIRFGSLHHKNQWRTQEFFSEGLRQEFFGGGGVQQIQLRIDGRESGNLGAIAP